MTALARLIDKLNSRIGRAIAWLTLLMVLVQFAIVLARYVFNIGSIGLQESIWYMHGIIFMVGAGYTLLHDGHVRVDVIYREAKNTTKARIDMIGTLIFLLPMCALTLWVSLGYVTNAWKVREGSTELAGLPFIYLLKTTIWLFAILVGLQGLSLLIKTVSYLANGSGDYSAGAGDKPVS
ncbi:MAG: TRAP transporter small permease subunit [Hyphomicrobiaceae bacterium]